MTAVLRRRPDLAFLTTSSLVLALVAGCASGGSDGPDAGGPRRDGGDGGGAIDVPVVACADDSECDDGDPCNGAETCTARVCAPGTAIDCGDGVACTTDACDSGTGTCSHTPDDTACSDGLVCDPVDDCTAPRPCTVDTDCDDGVFCNGEETCDPAFGCRRSAAPTCDDGLGCTNDACDATIDACVHTDDDTVCDDGLPCNGAEVCEPGDPGADGDGCVIGTAPACDDGVACTTDVCVDAMGGCVAMPVDTVCSDGVFCNGAERCDVTTGCTAGTPPTCDDGIGCTTGSCDPTTDACVQTGNDTVCQDSLVCNGSERCDVTGTTPGMGCVSGAPMDCSDGMACTTDSCTEPGTCVHGGSDADRDGYTAVGCATGNDCDDLVPSVHPGAAEICDGIDNDCSGTTDDGAGMQCALGSAPRACTTSCGSPGRQVCNGTCRLGPCVGIAEVCNDCDDDGNGLVDDGLPCRRGTSAGCTTSCGTPGSRVCASDCSGYGACVAAGETCNDCDDDGDGLVDDGLPCRRGTSTSCTTTCGTPGSRVCAVDCSGYGACRAASESCNGCDDDGDGAIDNGFACRMGATQTCTTACGTSGVRTCASDCSGYGACVATETCNGCDDDADGTVDDGFTCAAGATRSCTTACGGTGTQTCNATCGGWGACMAIESCNGCDDDGDGTADEDFACRQGATSACTTSCGTSGTRTCSATCSGFGACSATEVCNGCDDDANGVADNGFACVGGSSRTCTTTCGTSGSQACNGTCSGYGACSATEVCNGCDDDGNGVADNGFTCRQGATQTCTTACGTTGSQACNGTCSGFGSCSATEVCNGCDDDGNGVADNGFACRQGTTQACTTACGTAGSQTCNGSCSGFSTCVATAEVCGNGCDDNGNGSIDEGCTTTPPNDRCTAATAYTIGSTVSSTTAGATNDYASSCAASSGSPDVAYSFTADGSATAYRIHVDTTSHDGSIHVHNASTCAAGDEIGCNDDFGTTRASELTLNNLPQGTYYIVVDGYSTGNSGPFTLTSSTSALNPDTCSSPVAITANGVYTGTTAGRAANYTGSCGYLTDTSPDVVYAITARTSGTITATTCGSSFDTVLYVSTTCGSSTTCNDDSCGLGSSISFPTTAGTTYYIVVDGYNGQSGTYTLNITGY